MTKERMAFGVDDSAANEEAAAQVARKGVKLSSNRSKFGKQSVEKQQFAASADAAVASDMDRKTRAVQLVNKFWQVSQDKTLVENRGPLLQSIEAQLVKDLIEFANEMNNDPNELEGTGSVAVITLLLKTVLKARDTHNEMSYKIHNLEQRVTKLTAQVEQLKTNDKS